MTDHDLHDPNTVDRLLARIELMQAHHSEAITRAHHRAATADQTSVELRAVNEQLRKRLAEETGKVLELQGKLIEANSAQFGTILQAEKRGYDLALAELNGKPETGKRPIGGFQVAKAAEKEAQARVGSLAQDAQPGHIPVFGPGGKPVGFVDPGADVGLSISSQTWRAMARVWAVRWKDRVPMEPLDKQPHGVIFALQAEVQAVIASTRDWLYPDACKRAKAIAEIQLDVFATLDAAVAAAKAKLLDLR